MNSTQNDRIRALLADRIARQTKAVDMLREASCLVSYVALDCSANELQDARKLSDTVHNAYVEAQATLALLVAAVEKPCIRDTLTMGDL